MRRPFFICAMFAIAAFAPALALGADEQDKAIAEQIATELRDSGRMKNYSVGVKYRNGTVWLSGRVTSDEQMQSALGVVGNLEGVEQIVNNLSVGGGDGNSGLEQPSPRRSMARHASYSNPEAEADAPITAEYNESPSARSEVVPAGYHMLRGKHKFMRPMAMYGGGSLPAPAAYDQPHMPGYAWPSYAAYPNYAALTYPKQYSATAFPFIGPFYPYPQVPLGWRKVSLEWDDGWWFLDFKDRGHY